MELRILGTRGSFPSFGKEYREYGHDTSCYALVEDDYAIILDCGSGLAGALPIIRSCSKIDVLISHVHYDHIMGLFGMRDAFDGIDVNFYGEFDKWTADEAGNGNYNTLYHINELIKYNKVNIKHGEPIELGRGFSVRMLPSIHPDHSSLMIIRKGDKRVVYTGDYEHSDNFDIGSVVWGCDLLIIDGTYTDDEYATRKGWGHSKWTDTVKIALEYKIPKLIITHHESTHKDDFLREEEAAARAMYANADFAKQGETYII